MLMFLRIFIISALKFEKQTEENVSKQEGKRIVDLP